MLGEINEALLAHIACPKNSKQIENRKHKQLKSVPMTDVASMGPAGGQRACSGREGACVEPQSLLRERQRVSWDGTSPVDFLSAALSLFDCLIDIELVLDCVGAAHMINRPETWFHTQRYRIQIELKTEPNE